MSAAEALRFPQMRRDRHRPGSADDKIDFLPGELAGALGAPEPRRATAISCVVIPSVSQVARPIAVRPLPDGEKLDILTANCFAVTGDDVLRPWLPFGTLRSAPNVESLLALPCFEVSYHVDGCGDLVSTLAKSVDGRAGGGTG